MPRFFSTGASMGAFLAVLALLAGPALGAGFLVRENSAEAVATSYAGNGSRATGPTRFFPIPRA